MTQVQTPRASPRPASPTTPPPQQPWWQRKVEWINERMEPIVKLAKNLKVIAGTIVALIAVPVAFSAMFTPGGVMCVGLVSRAAATAGWDTCSLDDVDDPNDGDEEDLAADITIAIGKDDELIVAGAHGWKPRSIVTLKLIDPKGDKVRLRKSVRTFKANRHGSLGKRLGRVLWIPPLHHAPGTYTLIAKGRNADGTKARVEGTVRVR